MRHTLGEAKRIAYYCIFPKVCWTLHKAIENSCIAWWTCGHQCIQRHRCTFYIHILVRILFILNIIIIVFIVTVLLVANLILAKNGKKNNVKNDNTINRYTFCICANDKMKRVTFFIQFSLTWIKIGTFLVANETVPHVRRWMFSIVCLLPKVHQNLCLNDSLKTGTKKNDIFA